MEKELPSDAPSRFRWLWWGLYGVCCLAVYLRLMNYLGGHWPFYIHDRSRHEEYVRYVHETGLMPQPDAGVETHQQPLYYFFVAPFYQPSIDWQFRLAYLAGIGLLLSIFNLYILLISLKYISSWLIRYVLIVFIGLTPSLVFSSAFIGNDGMVAFMGIYLFFCILRFNRAPSSEARFILCIIAFMFVLFSKVNALALLPGIPFLLWRTYQNAPDQWFRIGRRVLLIGLVLSFWAAVTYYHSQLGKHGAGTNMIDIVNARDLAPMLIPDTGWNYVTTFHPLALIEAGQSTTLNTTPDSVRFSYLTFQYGTMMLGEYVYNQPPILLFASRLALCAGLVLVIGLLLYIPVVLQIFNRSRRHFPGIFKNGVTNAFSSLTICILILSSLAVYYFIYHFPYTCATDFRYQYPALAWIGYGIGRGLSVAPRNRLLQSVFIFGIILYAISSFYLITTAGKWAFTL